MATEEEQRARLRYLQLKKKKAESMQAAPAPEPAPVEGDPGFTDYAAQLARGVGEGVETLGRMVELPGRYAAGLMAPITQAVGEKYFPGTGVSTLAEEGEILAPSLFETETVKSVTDPLTDRVIPEGKTLMGDALYTFGEWATPGTLVTAPARVAGKGLCAAAPTKLDVATGAGAAAGEAIGGETGEIVGGLLPSGVSLVNTAYRAFRPKAAETTVDEKAREIIENMADDPQQAMANLRESVARGERGTLADLTKDRGIFNLEKAVPQGTPASRAIQEEIAARDDQLIGQLSDVMPTQMADDAQEVAQTALTRRKDAIDTAVRTRQEGLAQASGREIAESQARIGEATQQARQAETALDFAEEGAATARANTANTRAAIAPDMAASEASAALRTRYDDLEKQLATELEKPAWRRFEEGAPVEVQELKDSVITGLEGLPRAQSEDLMRKYNDIFRNVGTWGERAAPAEVQYVLSKIKDVTNSAKNTGNFGVLEKNLGELGRTMEGVLKGGSRKEFEEAVAATREKFARTGPGKIGKQRLKNEPETFARRLNWAYEDGAATLRLLREADDPEVMRGAAQYLRTLAQREGVDANFMDKYAEVLEGFPRLRDEFARAADTAEVQKITDEGLDVAEQQLARAEKEAGRVTQREVNTQNRLAKALEKEEAKVASRGTKMKKGLDGRALAKYAEAPTNTISSLLKNADGAPKLNRLFRAVSANGGEQAFKQDVNRVMEDVLAPIKKGETRRQITPESISEFVEYRKNLVDSGVMTPAEADDILRVLDKTENTVWRKQAVTQRMSAEEGKKAFENLVATAGATFALRASGVNNSLALITALRRTILRGLHKAKFGNAVADRVEDFMINPTEYANVVKQADTPQEYAEKLLRALTAGAQAEIKQEDQ